MALKALLHIPRIGCSFVTLFWAIFPPLQFRAHEANRPKQIWVNVIKVYHGGGTLRTKIVGFVPSSTVTEIQD
jgi:hypothetical protein